MARTAIVFGLMLCGLTLYGLVATLIKSPLQFVPLTFGIPIFFCGIVGLNPHRGRLAMPIAAVFAALGTAVGGVACIRGCLAWADGDPYRPLLLVLGAAMAVMCLVFFVACCVSLLRRRRRRLSAPGRRLERRFAEEA